MPRAGGRCFDRRFTGRIMKDHTIKNMRWFQVMEARGQIENNKVAHRQITLKMGFTI